MRLSHAHNNYRQKPGNPAGRGRGQDVAEAGRCRPSTAVEQWSTATNTATCPSPVTTVVRSVLHIASIRSVTIVPS